MIDSLSDLSTWISTQLATNHFATGGLLVGAAGVGVAVVRNLPARLGRWAWRTATVEVEVTDKSELFKAVEFWLATSGLASRTRVFRAQYRPTPPDVTGDDDDFDRPAIFSGPPNQSRARGSAAIELSPGTGRHYFLFERRPVVLTRIREEGKSERRQTERLELSFVTRDREIARRFFLAAVQACHPPEQRTVKVYTAGYDHWRLAAVTRARQPESVVLDGQAFDDLRADVAGFYTKAEWYHRLGIPYRRGYLLSGPPGNGKTSTIGVLAGLFDAPLCIIDLTSPEMSDKTLRDLMAAAPARAFFLLEDVDAAFHTRAKPATESEEGGRGVTFSGLLNALDGVTTPDGRLVFMTTNHPEKLDPALVRPGRVDKRVEFQNATAAQAERMFLRFFPDEEQKGAEFGRAMEGRSMAEVQNLLVEAGGDHRQVLK